jgi:hypothetical protein
MGFFDLWFKGNCIFGPREEEIWTTLVYPTAQLSATFFTHDTIKPNNGSWGHTTTFLSL